MGRDILLIASDSPWQCPPDGVLYTTVIVSETTTTLLLLAVHQQFGLKSHPCPFANDSCRAIPLILKDHINMKGLRCCCRWRRRRVVSQTIAIPLPTPLLSVEFNGHYWERQQLIYMISASSFVLRDHFHRNFLSECSFD